MKEILKTILKTILFVIIGVSLVGGLISVVDLVINRDYIVACAVQVNDQVFLMQIPTKEGDCAGTFMFAIEIKR